ncbi:MAG: hypothetical protein ACYS0I_03160 [Planctomycetota bacterium]|jgi:hypothetical protein
MASLIILKRLDAKSAEFFDICEDSYQKFQKSKAEFHEIKNSKSGKWQALLDVGAEMRHHFASTIVFGAMCLEAFIYDYAAHHFTDTFAKNYLDKLDLLSKWVVIPKLVTGKDFPTNSQAFKCLKELKTARNALVHHKSRPIPSNDTELEKLMDEIERKDDANTVNAHNAVREVLTELRKLEGGYKRGHWWIFTDEDQQKQ